MKVLAIGGSGTMGRYACRLAVGFDAVELLTVTDISLDRATRFAAELGEPAVGLQLDVRDEQALRAALSDADVVLNTAGPFYRFGASVLSAAIDAGCHYLDICDDWEPTLEMLTLDEQAREAGVTAIVGIGTSPGISNLLAAIAAGELDQPERILTGWNIDATQPERNGSSGANAAIMHGIRQMTDTIRVVRSRCEVDERPLRAVRVDYPGVGPRRAYTFGHPEPLTLTRSLPQIRDSLNVTHGMRVVIAFMRAMRVTVERGLMSAERLARIAERVELALPAPKPEQLFKPTGLPPIYALVSGRHEGRDASVAVALTGFPGLSMGALTGTPLAVALRLLCEDAIERRGVLPPEAAIQAHDFLTALSEHCVGSPSPDQMIVLTRSWDADATRVYRDAVESAQARVEHGPDVLRPDRAIR